MHISFWPPLQLITYAKVAEGILYTFNLETLKYGFMPIGRAHPYIQQIQQKVSSIILPITTSNLETTNSTNEQKNKFLPPQAQRQLVGLVMTLTLEIANWFDCHNDILLNEDLDLRKRITWHSFGIIDRMKTARGFIEDESLSMEERFHLACKYYLESNIQTLWSNMSIDEKNYFMKSGRKHKFIRYWMIQHSICVDWSKISDNSDLEDFFHTNYLGLSYYFTKVKDPESRFQCILSALKSETMHHFDVYYMLSRLNADELKAVFTLLPSKQIFRVFECFLHWPLQIIFMDVVNHFRDHITEDIFLDLIRFIIVDKLRQDWKDYVYVYLFRQIWYSLPPQYRIYVNMNQDPDKFNKFNEVFNLIIRRNCLH